MVAKAVEIGFDCVGYFINILMSVMIKNFILNKRIIIIRFIGGLSLIHKHIKSAFEC